MDDMNIHERASERPLGENARWLTIPELARGLNVRSNVIHDAIRTGALEAYAFGSEVRISAAGRSRFIARSKICPSARRRPAAFAVGALMALTILVSTTIAAQTTSAPDPRVVVYRGHLMENGQATQGPRQVTFQVYPSRDPQAQSLWSESHVVDVVNGQFSAPLGSTVALDDVLSSGSALYLGVTVDTIPSSGAVDLGGRQLLSSAPYARRGTPGDDFQVDGTLQLGGSLELNPSAEVAAGTLALQQVGGDGVIWVPPGGRLQFKSTSTGPAGDRLTVLSNGNVGLGTLNPGERLQVQGNVYASGNVTTGGTIQGAGGRADCGVPNMEFANCRANFNGYPQTACDFRMCNACGCGQWNPPGPGGQNTQILRVNPGY